MTRIRPTADVTLYVAPPTGPATGSWGDAVQVTIPAGSDTTGDGTKAAPFATPQMAADELYDDYDLRGQYKATIQLAMGPAGSPSAWIYPGMNISGRILGQAGTFPALTAVPGAPPWYYGKYRPFTLQGDIGGTVAPARGMAMIYPAIGPAVSLTDGAALKLTGLVMDSSASKIDCIGLFNGSFLDLSNIMFGYAGLNTGASHISVGFQSGVVVTGDYQVTGHAWSHMNVGEGASVLYDKGTGKINVAVSNAPYWEGAFFVGDSNGSIYANSVLVAFNGAATGKKYAFIGNALLDTGGHAGPADAFLPGNVAGTVGDYAVAR
jgi:hypothetical protein